MSWNSDLVYMCEQTSQQLKVRAKLAETLWTETAEFHVALYVNSATLQ